MRLEKGKLPRIDADVAGGCGMSIKFTLVFLMNHDEEIHVLNVMGFRFKWIVFTKRYLDETTKKLII
ncbi:hypothetical protein GCM10020331_002510 [Ectobacillus funiculus]